MVIRDVLKNSKKKIMKTGKKEAKRRSDFFYSRDGRIYVESLLKANREKGHNNLSDSDIKKGSKFLHKKLAKEYGDIVIAGSEKYIKEHHKSEAD